MEFYIRSHKASEVQVWAVQVMSTWTLRFQDGKWGGQCGGAQDLPGGQVVSDILKLSETFGDTLLFTTQTCVDVRCKLNSLKQNYSFLFL